MKKITLWLTCLSLAVLSPAPVAGQIRSRLIEWHEVCPPSAVPSDVLEVVEVTAGGERVAIGQPFDAGEGWLKGLTFRVKNISAAPVIDIRMGVTFPETKDEAQVLGLTLYNPELHRSASADGPARVPPGEEIDLILTDAQYVELRRLSDKRVANKSLTKLDVTPTVAVKFEGGVEVFGYFRGRQQ